MTDKPKSFFKKPAKKIKAKNTGITPEMADLHSTSLAKQTLACRKKNPATVSKPSPKKGGLGKSKGKKKLTDKQKMFCKEYLIDLNATQAAIRAGYSEKTAKDIGCQNLAKLYIQEYIQKAMDKRGKKIELTSEYILNNIMEIGERCMQRVKVMYFDKEDKEYKQVMALIKKKDGSVVEEGVWEFKEMGALKAQELLGKHKKLFTDRVEHSGKDGGPIEHIDLTGKTPEELAQISEDERNA